MPTLNIEGRKVKVDDSFLKLSPADQQATVEEIASQLGIKSSNQDAPVSGLFDQFRAGMESNTELPGQTIETFGKTAGSQGLQDAGSWLRDLTSQPDNFVSATDRFINPKQGDSYVDPVMGFGWGNLPGAAAEVGGQMTGDLAVRAGGAAIGGAVSGAPTAGAGAPVGAVVGGLAAPAILEFMRVAGPVAQERAKNNGRDVPDWSDWEAAAATAGLSGVLNSIGIKGIGALNKGVKEVGKKTAGTVVKEAVTETAKKAGKEGLTEFGQSITEQTGSTLGTDKGLEIDLKQAVGEGILGAGAGGVIDAGRNARPVVSAVNDIRSVDSAIQNDPFAREKAEITQNINDIANGPTRDSRELAPREITKMVDDLRAQAEEAIRGQNLSKQDKQALIRGLKNADGLSEERLNEIAGRSDSPDAIKALARKVQLVRSMTVQQQARKGARGWAAAAARYGGGVAGAAIGQSLGTGAIEGAAIGTGVGRVIAQKLSGSQSQGARINDLVGKKQARRAKMLLDRYGPSEATTALNTLTEQAALNKAQAEAEAQAKKDFEETMSRIRYMNSMRQKSQRAMEQANTKEERAKAAAEKAQYTAASREERLKGMAYRSLINKARAERLVQDLEQKKTLNALTVEMTKTRQELQQKIAEAKADSMNRQAKFEADNLKGKLEALALDIAKRQQALKKAEIATKRAEKMAQKAPASAGPALARVRAMGAKWAQAVQADDNIANKPAYQSATQYLDTLRQEAQAEIKAEPNEPVRNLLRETLTDLMTLKNNWEARRERFARAMRDAKDIPGAQQKLRDVLYQLAHYKAPEGGREDFGTSSDTSQDIPFDMPLAPSSNPVEAASDKVLNHSNVFIKSAEGRISALKAKADTLHAETGAIIQEAEAAYQNTFGNVANDNWFNDGWADMVSAEGKKKLQEYRKVQTELAKAELDVNYDKLMAYLPEEYTARRVTATRSMSSPKVQALYDMEEPAYRINIHRKSDGEWVGTIDGLSLFAKDVKKFFATLSSGERPLTIAEIAKWAGLEDDKLVKGLSEETRTDRGQSPVSKLPSNAEDPPF